MKRLLLLICLVVMAGTSAFGAGLCTDYTSPGTNVLTPGFSCSLGPLTFSGFSASAGGMPVTPVIALGTLTGLTGTVAVLDFDTNFDTNTLVSRDISFTFEVTGPVNEIDGWLGGSGNRNIFENVCASANCDVPGDPFVFLYLSQAQTTGSVPFDLSRNVWISKDISVSAGAGLSDFSQSFHTLPEPLAMVLVGSGLLGLGALRRRLRR